MNNDETPSVEEIKARLGGASENAAGNSENAAGHNDSETEYVEIPVDEEPIDTESLKDDEQPDIVVELGKLGRQFADTLHTAWNSQERQKFEDEVREGMKSFADELDKAFKEIKKSPVTQKAKEEASTFKSKVESGEVTQKTKSGLSQGLTWLSDELNKLANQFTPAEKSPEETAESSTDEA